MSLRSPELLKTVARGLKDKRGNFIFIGGTVISLYASDEAAPGSRPTFDVDCIIEIRSYARYAKMEEELHELGFMNDTSQDAPRCRYVYREIKVDIMPTPYEKLGYNDQWYTEGIQHTTQVPIAPDLTINILIFPYYLATKLEALADRGIADLRTSKDFEDIIFLFNNRKTALNEILTANESVKSFIILSFIKILAVPNIDEAISSVLDPGEPPGSVQRIKDILKQLCAS